MQSHGATHRATIWLLAAAALLPLAVFAPEFRKLYWFHDDWDMLDGASRLGLWAWMLEPFLKESVIPVSKALWLGAVRLTGGSYFLMIVLLFLTHALNVGLFGEILRRLHMPTPVMVSALVTFALPWSNIETLGWAMQWISVASVTFFLAAWLYSLASPLQRPEHRVLYMLLLFGSALSSSRGIVSGVLLGVFDWFRTRSARLAAFSIAPVLSLLVVMEVVMASTAPPSVADAFNYAMHYWLLNPLFLLLPIPGKGVDTRAFLLCGALKLTLLAAAWVRWRDQRPVLLMLLSFDLLTAASAGWARASTGVSTAVSSRYQYISLFCFGTPAGLLLVGRQRWLICSTLILWTGLITWPWTRHAPRWAQWRGVDVRSALQATPAHQLVAPAQITADRARELSRQYNLH